MKADTDLLVAFLILVVALALAGIGGYFLPAALAFPWGITCGLLGGHLIVRFWWRP